MNLVFMDSLAHGGGVLQLYGGTVTGGQQAFYPPFPLAYTPVRERGALGD